MTAILGRVPTRRAPCRGRPSLLGLMALAILGGGPPAASQGPAPAPVARPNVLFLLADDQRADTLAALGNARIRTPNLDRLVREGTAFTRAYCMGAMQGAVCV